MSSQRRGTAKSLKAYDSRVLIVENVISGSFNGVPADRILTADDAENAITGGGISSTTNLTVVNLNATNGIFEKVRINDSGTGSGNIANVDADEFVISSNGVGGMTIFSDDASFGAIYFGDTSDNDIGRIIYDHLTNTMNLYVNNTNIMSISGSDVDITGDLNVTGTVTGSFALTYPLLANPTGTPTAPAYSFTGDSNTGMYRPSDNTVALSVNGVMAVQASTALGSVDIDSFDLKINNGKGLLLEAAASGGYMDGSVYDTTNYFGIYGSAYGGTKATPTAVLNNRIQLQLTGQAYDGSSTVQGAYIDFLTNGNWSGTAHGSQMDFYATGTGSGEVPFNILQLKGSTTNAQVLTGTNSISEPALSWQIDTQSGFNNDGSGVATIVRKSIFANTSYLSSDIQMNIKGTNVGAAGAPPAPSIGFSRPDLITSLSYTGFSGTSDTVANSRISIHVEGANSDQAGYVIGYFSKNGIHMKTNGSRSNQALYSFTSDISTGINYPSDFTIGFLVQSDTKLSVGSVGSKVKGTLTVIGTSLSAYTPTISADNLVVEDTQSGISIVSAPNNTTSLIMGTSSTPNRLTLSFDDSTMEGTLSTTTMNLLQNLLLVGNFLPGSNSPGGGLSAPQLQYNYASTNPGDLVISLQGYGGSTVQAAPRFTYSRSGQTGSIDNTPSGYLLGSNDYYGVGNGQISFLGTASAKIECYVDATTASNKVPGNLIFSTQTTDTPGVLKIATVINSSQQFLTSSGSETFPGISFTSDTNTGIFRSSDNQIQFSTNGTEALRINNSSKVSIGSTGGNTYIPSNKYDGPTFETILQLANASGGTASNGIQISTFASSVPGIILSRSAGTTHGTYTFVPDTEKMGEIWFMGASPNADSGNGAFVGGCQISVIADGTGSGSIQPAKFRVSTMNPNATQTIGFSINKYQTIELNSENRGTATLVGGTVTVNTTSVLASSYIFVSRNTPGGTEGHLSAPIASIVANTSFVINSSSGTDTSTVNWFIMN